MKCLEEIISEFLSTVILSVLQVIRPLKVYKARKNLRESWKELTVTCKTLAQSWVSSERGGSGWETRRSWNEAAG